MKRTRAQTMPALARANKRAVILVETMLREMQLGLKDFRKLESKEWTRLFGDKQSVVANLQKLVQSLATLSDAHTKKANAGVDHPEGVMNMHDMRILSAWMHEENAAQADQ